MVGKGRGGEESFPEGKEGTSDRFGRADANMGFSAAAFCKAIKEIDVLNPESQPDFFQAVEKASAAIALGWGAWITPVGIISS